MIRTLVYASIFLVVASAQQCPVPECRANSNTTSTYGSGTRECKVGGINIMPRPPSAIAAQAPQCYLFAKESEYHRTIDNTCLTLFPNNDTKNSYTLYESIVYCDGSFELKSYVIRDYPDGNVTWGGPSKTETDRVIGYAGCGCYVYYRCGNTGDIAAPMSFGMGPVPPNGGELDEACFQRARQIILEADLPQKDEFYRFPYKLPTQCVYQQICQPQASPLYSQEGGTCQAYEFMNATAY